jgi:hypothetical protein
MEMRDGVRGRQGVQTGDEQTQSEIVGVLAIFRSLIHERD